MSDNTTIAATPAAVCDFPRTPKRGDPTLAEVADAYMAAYAGRDKSRQHYLGRWTDALGDRRLSELDADLIADTLDSFTSAPRRRFKGRDASGRPSFIESGRWSAATINRSKATLSGVLTWAKRERLTPRGWHNPCHDVAGRREPRGRDRFLSSEERDRLLKVARISKQPRLYLLILMALTTGARRGELMALRFRDIDLAAATAHVARTKNGHPRVLVLTPAVGAEIKRLGIPNADAYLFASRYAPDRAANFDTAWRKALRLARIERFRFHDLRHTAASLAAQEGASLLQIADLLGHRTLAMVARYSHLVLDDKRRLVSRVFGSIGVNAG
jgi:integrase